MLHTKSYESNFALLPTWHEQRSCKKNVSLTLCLNFRSMNSTSVHCKKSLPISSRDHNNCQIYLRSNLMDSLLSAANILDTEIFFKAASCARCFLNTLSVVCAINLSIIILQFNLMLNLTFSHKQIWCRTVFKNAYIWQVL